MREESTPEGWAVDDADALLPGLPRSEVDVLSGVFATQPFCKLLLLLVTLSKPGRDQYLAE
jgi:predicted TIM-barrel enzyme